MKSHFKILVFAMVLVLIALTTCNKNENDDPDPPLVTENSDTLSPGYGTWLDTNLYNAIFGTGQAVIFLLNHPGTVDEAKDYFSGDTAITVSRRYLNADSCRLLLFGVYPGRTAGLKTGEIAGAVTEGQGSNKSSVRFPGSQCIINGGTVISSPIEVNDNRVSLAGYSFSISEPTPFGPPTLASLLTESINNPPPCPSANEVAGLECGEIIGCYFISREIHVCVRKEWNWTSGNNSYHESQIYNFGYSNYWYYACPDGPLVHEIFVSASIITFRWTNGILQENSTVQGYYKYTY
jgi:hypothetical protein